MQGQKGSTYMRLYQLTLEDFTREFSSLPDKTNFEIRARLQSPFEKARLPG